jgi:hypothetical protein
MTRSKSRFLWNRFAARHDNSAPQPPKCQLGQSSSILNPFMPRWTTMAPHSDHSMSCASIKSMEGNGKYGKVWSSKVQTLLPNSSMREVSGLGNISTRPLFCLHHACGVRAPNHMRSLGMVCAQQSHCGSKISSSLFLKVCGLPSPRSWL